jgi:hypothetical protein
MPIMTTKNLVKEDKDEHLEENARADVETGSTGRETTRIRKDDGCSAGCSGNCSDAPKACEGCHCNKGTKDLPHSQDDSEEALKVKQDYFETIRDIFRTAGLLKEEDEDN